MTRKLSPTDTDDIVKNYLSGESTPSLGRRLGWSHKTVIKLLRKRGVTIRNSRAATTIRLAGLTQKQRDAYTMAAHEAVRGRKASDEEQMARAVTRQKRLLHVGRGERTLAKMLNKRGVKTTLQLAVDRYNIDIATPTVAVELLCTAGIDPMQRSNDKSKVVCLIKRGWHVIYVMGGLRQRGGRVTETTADEVLAFIELTKSYPPNLREYRVIRSTGELLSRREYDLDKLT